MSPHPASAFARASFLIAFSLLTTGTVLARDAPVQTINWPDSGSAILRFTFSKFKEVGSLRNEHTFVTDTTAENLWNKTIPEASFSLYLFDKNNVRIGEGYVYISNVGKGQVVKFQTTVNASGSPISLSLAAKSLPPELGGLA